MGFNYTMTGTVIPDEAERKSWYYINIYDRQSNIIFIGAGFDHKENICQPVALQEF